ncbi:MAG: 50S ribosomal protein L32 [Dehalococcoidia bacterium]
MALPKKKYSKSRQGKRRSHLQLTRPAMDACPHCHSPKLSHRVCPNCGWYNDREVIEVKPSKKK